MVQARRHLRGGPGWRDFFLFLALMVMIKFCTIVIQSFQFVVSIYVSIFNISIQVKTSRVFVREVSMVPMIAMVLFGGTGLEVVRERGQERAVSTYMWVPVCLCVFV